MPNFKQSCSTLPPTRLCVSLYVAYSHPDFKSQLRCHVLKWGARWNCYAFSENPVCFIQVLINWLVHLSFASLAYQIRILSILIQVPTLGDLNYHIKLGCLLSTRPNILLGSVFIEWMNKFLLDSWVKWDSGKLNDLLLTLKLAQTLNSLEVSLQHTHRQIHTHSLVGGRALSNSA